MSITLKDLFSETKRVYRLQLLAGKSGLDSNVSWVYLMEDTAIADYFWGNELAITTGVGGDDELWLLNLVNVLVEHGSSGLIINVGKYIDNIPPAVIEYCNSHNFPLLTMPWEIFLTEVIKDYCMRIFLDSRNDETISTALINAIRSPKNEEAYLETLQNYFNVDSSFLAITAYLEFPEDASRTSRPKAESRIRSLLSRISEKFNLFRLEDVFVIILNGATAGQASELAQEVWDKYKNNYPDRAIHIGIGNIVNSVTGISESFRRARAAMRMAIVYDKSTVTFSDMGIYKLFFTTEDFSILRELYNEILAPLLEYDLHHNTCLTDTLEHYIKSNGSVQTIAANTFTHRNTVNYRVHRIKEILGSNLDSEDELFKYRAAFYIKEILKL